jgi:hypothetical protein
MESKVMFRQFVMSGLEFLAEEKLLLKMLINCIPGKDASNWPDDKGR